MKSIALEEVQAAYTKHRLNPRRGDWFFPDECACGIAAFFFDCMCKLPEKMYGVYYILNTDMVKDLGYDIDYVYGFIAGFDLQTPIYDLDKYMRGYSDGKRIGVVLLGDKS